MDQKPSEVVGWPTIIFIAAIAALASDLLDVVRDWNDGGCIVVLVALYKVDAALGQPHPQYIILYLTVR